MRKARSISTSINSSSHSWEENSRGPDVPRGAAGPTSPGRAAGDSSDRLRPGPHRALRERPVRRHPTGATAGAARSNRGFKGQHSGPGPPHAGEPPPSPNRPGGTPRGAAPSQAPAQEEEPPRRGRAGRRSTGAGGAGAAQARPPAGRLTGRGGTRRSARPGPAAPRLRSASDGAP